jgi:AAA domain
MITSLQNDVSSTTPIHQLSTQDGTVPVSEILPTQDTPSVNPTTPALDAAEEKAEREKPYEDMSHDELVNLLRQQRERLDSGEWNAFLSKLRKACGSRANSAITEFVSGVTGKSPHGTDETAKLNLSFVPVEDFIERDIPEPPSLIGGILYEGGIMLLSGAAKTNKSWTAKEIGISIAQGKPWLGFDCAQGRVLYVNNEIKEYPLQQRLKLLMHSDAMGPTPKGQMVLANLRGESDANIETLTEALINGCKPGDFAAIIIDPIYTLLGEYVENDNGDIAEVGNMLARVAKETGAAVIFVHHHSKGGQSNKRSIERNSGAGSWGRFPDAVLDITLKDKAKKLFEMSPTLRDFIDIDDFLVERIGNRWERSSVLPSDLKDDDDESEYDFENLCKEVADLVGTDVKINNTDWQARAKESLGIGRKKFTKTRDWLVENGIANMRPSTGGSHLYYFDEPLGKRFRKQD